MTELILQLFKHYHSLLTHRDKHSNYTWAQNWVTSQISFIRLRSVLWQTGLTQLRSENIDGKSQKIFFISSSFIVFYVFFFFFRFTALILYTIIRILDKLVLWIYLSNLITVSSPHDQKWNCSSSDVEPIKQWNCELEVKSDLHWQL